jgi:hypothetical protein
MDADCSVDGTIPNRNDQLFLTRCGFATQTTEEQSAPSAESAFRVLSFRSPARTNKGRDGYSVELLTYSRVTATGPRQ